MNTIYHTIFLFFGIVLIFISQCTIANAQTIKDPFLSHGLSGDVEQQTIEKGTELKEALFILEETFGVYFLYRSQLLDQKIVPNVEVLYQNRELSDILQSLLNGSDLTYRQISRRTIGIAPKDKIDGSLDVYQETVRGTVVDAATGEVLPGVNVVVKGSAEVTGAIIGTSTNVDGQFELSVPSLDDDTLVFTYIGYQAQEIAIDGRTEIDVQLQSHAITGAELVVVGYGTARARDLTGSVARVDLERTELQPNANVVQSLRGTVPGVHVIDDGRPGSSGTIRIRGQNSISASNNPLIVLDGVIFSGGSLSDINQNDIESIEILKDASATAIYGSLAANGVILITSKKGITDEPRISFNSYIGVSGFANLPNYLNAEQYLQAREDANRADGGTHPFSQLEQENINAGITINPFDEIKQRAPATTNELSLSGRSEYITYYISGAYTAQKSPVRGDNFSRITSRINLDLAATNWLNVGTNSGYSGRDQSGNRASLLQTTYLSPFANLYYDDGIPRPLPMNIGLVQNPLRSTLLNDNSDEDNTLFTNVYADVKLPLQGLSYRLNTGYTEWNRKNYNYTPSFDRGEFFNLGYGSRANQRSQDYSIENIVRYDRGFTDNHTINMTFLYGAYVSQNEGSSASSRNIFNDALGYNSLEIGDDYTISTWAGKDQQVSLMTRLGYIYKDKYIIDFTVRRDGYSAFGPNDKYAVFPAVGLSWNIFEEDFLREVEQLNNLKIRFSWGESGNRGVGRNSALSLMAQTNYVFGGESAVGLYPQSLANPNLGWETTTSTNVGIDFGIFYNRLSGTFDVYFNHTHDLLLNQRIPNISGFNSILTNVGETQNRGFEFSLNSVNIEKTNFSWNTNIVFSLNRNKIVALSRDGDDIASGWFIGHPLGSNFDYVFDGIWQEGDDFSLMPDAQPGDIRFKDIDGDGEITPADRQVLHSNQPDFLTGITNTISYKGISLMAMVNIRKGGYSSNQILNHGSNFYYSVNILDTPYWTPENPINTHPAINYSNPRGYGFYQSRSYVRLQDVTLSYELPIGLIEKLNLRNLQLYLSGKNLITLTNWEGWDPEFGGGGRGPGNNGPLSRTFTLGLKIQI